ncbi:Choline/ethanolaminephosphotransferase 1-like Protein [Tribolium castaneum]|uniref:diacylglycerol cholinephosphotransferase n=1 Tax=Tribolium castaneum TaxID=7070 RepID=A0A139WJ77_TRICA|nr:Choline/ethanolaminephosphotransferase 1-like Protein [Tribolium castaneum]
MMKLYKERLLSDAQLKRLGEHQYSCQSVSILDKLLQPYWNWLTSKVPIWLAPNLITILGLIVNIVTALILIWFSPDAKQEAPRWACGLCGFGLFVYQSLDAIDGKQARRTGTANPLGELFDHGCDSISTVFVALSACIAVQLGYYPGWMFFQCFCAMTLFYCAHWQTYVSGTLRFGRIDVTEAQYTIMGILLLSTIFGPSVWSTKFFSGTVCLWYLIPLSTLICGLWSLYQSIIVIFTGGVGKNGSTVAVFGFTFHWAHVVCTVFYLGFFQLFYTFFERIKEGGCGKNGSTVAVRLNLGLQNCTYCSAEIPGLDMEVKLIPIGVACAVALLLAQANVSIIFTGGVGKNGSTVAGTSVLSPVIPFSMVLVPAFIIYQKSTQHVYEEHPALYILAFGLVAAKVTNRLVVAHMTKSEMDYMDWSLLGPTMLFLNQYFNTFIKEYYILWLCMIWVIVDLLRYCYQICQEICDFLHVELFRIPYPGGPQRVVTLPSEKNGTNLKSVKSRKSKHY